MRYCLPCSPKSFSKYSAYILRSRGSSESKMRSLRSSRETCLLSLTNYSFISFLKIFSLTGFLIHLEEQNSLSNLRFFYSVSSLSLTVSVRHAIQNRTNLMNYTCCGDFSWASTKERRRSQKSKEPGQMGEVVDVPPPEFACSNLSCSSDQQSTALLRKRYLYIHGAFSASGRDLTDSKPKDSNFMSLEYRFSKIPLLIVINCGLKCEMEVRQSKTIAVLHSVVEDWLSLFQSSFMRRLLLMTMYLMSNLLIWPRSVHISVSYIWPSNFVVSSQDCKLEHNMKQISNFSADLANS